MSQNNEALINFCGQPMKVVCDRQCDKAWGMNTRPTMQLSPNEDDWAWLPDHLLGEAPADPGTYEGSDGKPESPDDFPNRWCVRECERCEKSEPGKWRLPLAVRKFDEYVCNLPQN
jgi:hypothetical protein